VRQAVVNLLYNVWTCKAPGFRVRGLHLVGWNRPAFGVLRPERRSENHRSGVGQVGLSVHAIGHASDLDVAVERAEARFRRGKFDHFTRRDGGEGDDREVAVRHRQLVGIADGGGSGQNGGCKQELRELRHRKDSFSVSGDAYIIHKYKNLSTPHTASVYH
jgi:hypothetical protein